MKSFRFPLDRALHIRRLQLEIEQAKLQRLLQHRERLDLESAEILRDSSNTRIMISTQSQVLAHEVATVPDYQRCSKRRLHRLDQLKLELIKQTDDQSRQAMDAERRVKLLEQLREKRFSTWNSLLQREQENFAADAYLARWTVGH